MIQVRLKQTSSLCRPLVQLCIFSPSFGLGLLLLLVVLVLPVLPMLVQWALERQTPSGPTCPRKLSTKRAELKPGWQGSSYGRPMGTGGVL